MLILIYILPCGIRRTPYFTADSRQSLVVKYAPPFIKVLGLEYALTADRLAVEHRALQEFHTRAPGMPFLN